MTAFETSSIVGGQGEIHLVNVPFEPGTPVEVIVSPKPANRTAANTTDPLRSLFAALDQAHNQAPIGSLKRDDLYDRNGLH